LLETWRLEHPHDTPLAYCELDDTLRLTDTAADTLADAGTGKTRAPARRGHRQDAGTGKNGRHRLAGLPRQAVFGRLAGYELAGYEDVNDAERLCRYPALRRVVGDRVTMAGRSRPGDQRVRRLGQPEGARRDKVAQPAREPRRADRSARPVD
jgi:hypothetical protein